MFGMVVEKLFMADLQKVSGGVDRKICAVGVTKILTEAPAMLQADYVKLWSVSLRILYLCSYWLDYTQVDVIHYNSFGRTVDACLSVDQQHSSRTRSTALPYCCRIMILCGYCH